MCRLDVSTCLEFRSSSCLNTSHCTRTPLAVEQVQRNGGWTALVRLLFLGASGGAAGTAAGAGRPGLYATVQQARQQQQQQQQRRPPRATTEQVAAVLQKLPTEVFATAADLEAMSAPELKARAHVCVDDISFSDPCIDC